MCFIKGNMGDMLQVPHWGPNRGAGGLRSGGVDKRRWLMEAGGNDVER